MRAKNRGERLAPLDFAERPRYAAAAIDDLLTGSRKLRQALLRTPMRFAGRDAPLVKAGAADPEIILVRSGFAFRSCALMDGRRAILDIVAAGDFIGLDHVVLQRPIEEITAATRVGYNALDAATMRELMRDPAVALEVVALVSEARRRSDRLAASIGRLDAQARICVMLLDIYDRLRQRGLIGRDTFNLPMTQEQIADHLGLTLVHVNRTLRRLREERLVLVDRQVVIIMDLDRLRQLALGLPQSVDHPERVLDPPPPAQLMSQYSGSPAS